MLSGHASSADLLLAEVFGHDPGPRSHEALLDELVRVFLRHAHHRHEDGIEHTRRHRDTDPGDVLASLGPRERAAAVLVRVEGWSPERAARTLHVHPRTVRSLVPQVAGLEVALEAIADQHARPSREVVATALAAVPVPGPAPGSEPARHTVDDVEGSTSGHPADRGDLLHLPRRWRRLAAAVGLGALVWVSVLGQDTGGGARAPEAQPVRPTLALVDGTALPVTGDDLTGRGWVLDPAGEPPVDLEGLRLIEVVRIDLAGHDEPVRVDTVPRAGAAVFGVLWCDLPVADAHLVTPGVRLRIGHESAELPCAGSRGEPAVRRPVPLPPTAGPGRATARFSWTGDVPERGGALLAVYTESGAGPAPAEAGTPVLPVADHGSVVISAASRSYQVQGLPVYHRRVRIGPDSTVRVWAGAVGAVAVQMDHVVLTSDDEPAWRRADPELRDGRWLVYRPAQAREFAVPAEVRPGPGQTRVVTVAVTSTVEAPWWQVHVRDAETARRVGTPIRPTRPDADVPRWVAGHRLAAAWEVPGDGVPHTLVDPGLRPGRRFVLVGSSAGVDTDAWGVVTPHVATTRGAVEMAVVHDVTDAFREEIWLPGDQLVQAGAATADVRTGTGTVVVAVVAPAAARGTGPATLLAYESVPYEMFDFSAAPPTAASVPLAASGGATAEGSRTHGTVVGRWTRADLDDEGGLALDVEGPGPTRLRLTTAGRGRVQVLEDGRPVVWLPDGWWTPWTAEPVVTELRLVRPWGSTGTGPPLGLRVEGHEELFVVEAVGDDDGDGDADPADDT